MTQFAPVGMVLAFMHSTVLTSIRKPQRGAMPVKQRDEILSQIRSSRHPHVKVAIADIDGILRGKYLLRDKFLSILDSGFGFCNVVFGWDAADVCYDNSPYTGWFSGYPDANAKIDFDTYRVIPWEDNQPFFLGEFFAESGEPLSICPRQLLRTIIARAEKMGFRMKAGMEFEWFNFKETPQSLADKSHASPIPLTPGMYGYSITRTTQNQAFFRDLLEKLLAFGVPLEGLHTETGPGVFEAAVLYADALESADRATLFKASVKEIASLHGITASFMAKWNAQLPGCSGHCHQSLWTDDGHNAFYNANDKYSMSPLFRHYTAGILHALPVILPLFAPTVNSYKRLVDGYWAPTKATWGIDNRTVAARVIPGSSKSTRLELRVPGADVNPYLTFAGCLAAGLYGIENKIELGDPVIGSAYSREDIVRLPRDLGEATEQMANSPLAKQLLGAAFVDHFVATRRWEWRQFQNAVTNWELQRYFEII